MTICKCEKYCHGHAEVTRETYKRHAPHHRSSAFTEFLATAASTLSGKKRAAPLTQSPRAAKRQFVSDAAGPSTLTAAIMESGVVEDRVAYEGAEDEEAARQEDLIFDENVDTFTPNVPLEGSSSPHSLEPELPSQPDTINESTPPPPSLQAPDPGSIVALVLKELQDVRDVPEPLPETGVGPQDLAPTPDDEPTRLDPEALRPTAKTAPHTIQDIAWTQAFIRELQTASLDKSGLDEDTLERLRNPPKNLPEIDRFLRHSIDTFLAVTNASRETYNDIRAGYLRCHPDATMLSYAQVKRSVAELSGMVSVVNDMCIN
ncbi:hypothetical protein OF83DRAFT_1172300, partial [Amylostereum chailletii]